jgi:tetratricopeptide (TPR) repeat protein
VLLLWTTWRDKVLAGGSFEHVMALAALGVNRPADLSAVLARAAELAGTDDAKLAQVVRAGMNTNLGAWAWSVLEPRLAQHPSYALHQLAGQLALAQSRPVDALAHFEAAQQLAADDAVELATVRDELMTILEVARQAVAVTQGAERDAIVARAAGWASTWRAIDEGNPEIDQQLGELYLATGNTAEAWRQLSTVIERDPMAGTGYMTVAAAFEQQGRVEAALAYWQQAIVLDQTDPTPRVRKAQALIALGRQDDGDALLREVANRTWHDAYQGMVWQARSLLQQRKPR